MGFPLVCPTLDLGGGQMAEQLGNQAINPKVAGSIPELACNTSHITLWDLFCDFVWCLDVQWLEISLLDISGAEVVL